MNERLPIKVLYAEDEGYFRSVMAEFLSELTQQVFIAENGLKGLELFRKHHPDLVITDIAMPVMNGMRMLKEIKKEAPQVRSIITTSYGETDYFIEAIELGVDRFILKPFENKALYTMIRDLASGILHEIRLEQEEENRRITEIKLRESELQFRILFESAPQPIILVDPAKEEIIDLNANALKVLQYNKDEIVGVKAGLMMSDTSWLSPMLNPGEAFMQGVELQLYTKDGRRVPVEVHHTSLQFTETTLSFGIFTDLTSRKMAEESIWLYQNKLEDLVEERTFQLQDANEKLRNEVAERKEIQDKLIRRVHIENLITSISTLFINLPTNSIQTEIRNSLSVVAETAGVERAFLWIFQEDAPCLKERIVWASEGFLPRAEIPAGFDFSQLTYIYSHLSANRPVIIDNVDHHPFTDTELRIIGRNRTRSFLMVPLMIDKVLFGMIGIDSIRENRFDDDILFLLGITGKVFVDAIIRKETALALIESEEKARALLNASPDSMVLLNHHGVFLEINEKAATELGEPSRLINHANYFDGLPTEVKTGRYKFFEQVMRTGKKALHFDSVGDKNFEHVFFPIKTSDETKGRVALLTRDITEQLKNQAQIRNQYYFLQVLINNIPNPIYYKDIDGKYLGCNNAFLTAVGKRMEDILGKTIFEIEDPEVAKEYSSKDDELIEKLGIQTFESRFRFADGETHDVLFNKSVFYLADGSLGGIIGIMIDISELKRIQNELKELNTNLEKRVAEELKKTEHQQQLLIQKSKLESLGKMSAGIAHEINQPLSAISLGLENILFKINQKKSSEQYLREKISSLFENIKRIKLIIEHVRTFSRDQQGPALSRTDLNEAVNGALLLLGTQYKNNRIVFNLMLDKNPLWFLGNRFKVEQVVINLLNNAKDALDEKVARVDGSFSKIITLRTFSEDNKIILEVEDNGAGISDENLERVFDPFFTTKGLSSGTGLGLSIVYGIVEEMKGAIQVKSCLGEQTCFKVSFPACSGPDRM